MDQAQLMQAIALGVQDALYGAIPAAARQVAEEQAARIATLEAALAERDAKAKTTLATIRHAHYFLKEYTNDSLNATHAKRVLSNALHALTPKPKEPTDG